MRLMTIVCFVLAGVSTFAAIGIAINSGDRPITYTVGVFVLPVVFLVGGLTSLRKPQK